MTRDHDLRRRVHVALLALLTGVATGGCVAAGLAGGPLVSAVQMVGERSVERTVGTDIHEAWAAVETALIRMAFRVEAREREAAEWRLRGVADRVTIHARLERVTSRLTRVMLRVETGSIFPDRKTADVIHDQIARSVAEAGGVTLTGPPVGGVPSDALMSLEAEVRRLRTEMEDRREAGRPPAERGAEPAAAMRVEPSAVVTVPLSAALPTIPGPAPPSSVAQPVNGAAPAAAALPVVGTIAGDDSTVSFGSARTAPLRPAAALVPIQPVSGPGSGK